MTNGLGLGVHPWLVRILYKTLFLIFFPFQHQPNTPLSLALYHKRKRECLRGKEEKQEQQERKLWLEVVEKSRSFARTR